MTTYNEIRDRIVHLADDASREDWLKAIRARAVVELDFAPGKDSAGLLKIVQDVTRELDAVAPPASDEVDEVAEARENRRRDAG